MTLSLSGTSLKPQTAPAESPGKEAARYRTARGSPHFPKVKTPSSTPSLAGAGGEGKIPAEGELEGKETSTKAQLEANLASVLLEMARKVSCLDIPKKGQSDQRDSGNLPGKGDRPGYVKTGWNGSVPHVGGWGTLSHSFILPVN